MVEEGGKRATFDLTACLRLASDRRAKNAKMQRSRSDRVIGKFDVMAAFVLAQKVARLCHQNQVGYGSSNR